MCWSVLNAARSGADRRLGEISSWLFRSFLCYSPLCTPLQVNLHREFIFRNSKKTYDGVPVIASNMDTVGTFEMAAALSEVSLFLSLCL